MIEKFLVKESKRIHKATRRRLRICTLLFVCFMVLLYVPVSYTHLDVYKRQSIICSAV